MTVFQSRDKVRHLAMLVALRLYWLSAFVASLVTVFFIWTLTSMRLEDYSEPAVPLVCKIVALAVTAGMAAFWALSKTRACLLVLFVLPAIGPLFEMWWDEPYAVWMRDLELKMRYEDALDPPKELPWKPGERENWIRYNKGRLLEVEGRMIQQATNEAGGSPWFSIMISMMGFYGLIATSVGWAFGCRWVAWVYREGR